jgi:hypothetical protein
VKAASEEATPQEAAPEIQVITGSDWLRRAGTDAARKSTAIVVPSPNVLDIEMSAACAVQIDFTIDNPSPAPLLVRVRAWSAR